jgi:VanZ like protein
VRRRSPRSVHGRGRYADQPQDGQGRSATQPRWSRSTRRVSAPVSGRLRQPPEMDQLWRVFGARALLLLVPAAAVAVWGLAAWRTRTVGRRVAWLRSVLDVGLVLAVVPVPCLVFVPFPGLPDRTMISLVPGSEIAPIFGGEGGTPASSALVQAVGNLLLLVPVAVLAPLRIRSLRSVSRVLLVIFVVSVVIECAQVLGHIGRVGAVDDVLLNTAGATLAAWATRPWWTRVPADRPQRPERSRASLGRRAHDAGFACVVWRRCR